MSAEERGEEGAVSELLLAAAKAATQRSLSHGEEEDEGKGFFGTGDDDRGLATALALLTGPPKSAEREGNLPVAPLGAAAVVGFVIIALLQV